MFILAVPFFLTALVYASVGFAGGSTYTAILSMAGIDYRIIPVVSLCCNIIVSAGGCWRFSLCGLIDWRRTVSWASLSVPMAFLGGLLPVGKVVFFGVLGAALLLAGIRLLFLKQHVCSVIPTQKFVWPVVLPCSAGLGLLAGITGIGGGIYLAPLLHFLKWDNARQIAATCSFFIFINSLAGILGQMLKLSDAGLMRSAIEYWPLALLVFVGGSAGSWLGATRLSLGWITRATGILTCYAGAQLISKFLSLLW
ncbi:MAG: sulfite exporter TauE/SafE family protein [Rhodospirillales bacterium]|nr:sulfite exporter TauE/SafE family protein [Alphaproteobacteria bacterium]MCB9986818.1 sulfite exporter TauE/SafE family protein [Rhodospirillales bacterium]USO08417.1 MAG: sulfite exporter TauE/SafE family protein [Rhodospirillales bacterium]